MKFIFIISAFILVIISSCTKVSILADPYWVELVPDLQEHSFDLKIQALLNGYILKIYVSDTKGMLSDDNIGILKTNKKNIIILSPFMSTEPDRFQQNIDNLVYYFRSNVEKGSNESINTRVITRDRTKAFFDTGSLLSTKLSEHSVLPLIYAPSWGLSKSETESFKDGVVSGGKDISFIYLKVEKDTSEEDVRTFYNQIDKTKIKYIAVFSSKFKYLSYNLAQKDNMELITSDSGFGFTHRKIILYSIEDDIKGMLKKVYSNAKTEKPGVIYLDGVILK